MMKSFLIGNDYHPTTRFTASSLIAMYLCVICKLWWRANAWTSHSEALSLICFIGYYRNVFIDRVCKEFVKSFLNSNLPLERWTVKKSTFSRCIYKALIHHFAHEMRMLSRIRNEIENPPLTRRRIRKSTSKGWAISAVGSTSRGDVI